LLRGPPFGRRLFHDRKTANTSFLAKSIKCPKIAKAPAAQLAINAPSNRKTSLHVAFRRRSARIQEVVSPSTSSQNLSDPISSVTSDNCLGHRLIK
jgi:hypothetical protein